MGRVFCSFCTLIPWSSLFNKGNWFAEIQLVMWYPQLICKGNGLDWIPWYKIIVCVFYGINCLLHSLSPWYLGTRRAFDVFPLNGQDPSQCLFLKGWGLAARWFYLLQRFCRSSGIFYLHFVPTTACSVGPVLIPLSLMTFFGCFRRAFDVFPLNGQDPFQYVFQKGWRLGARWFYLLQRFLLSSVTF